MTEHLYGVSISGPDDLIAVSDRDAAIALAHRINTSWIARVVAGEVGKDDPEIWASPVVWPHSESSHASSLLSQKHGSFSDVEETEE